MKTDTSSKNRNFLHKAPPSHETYCVMKLHCFFLLVYLGTFTVGSSAFRNPTCARRNSCDPEPDATSHFLQCVGLPPTDTGRDHMHRLKRILEGTMDIYTFMRSSLNGVPLLSLEGELELNGRADPLQNEALVQMWLEVKMKPLLKSITKNFLSCLSTKNFSCSTYQTVIRELSQHYSEMNPAQQKWIYTFFMYPFLSGDGTYGCADPEESSEEWLMKNFGAFRAMARMKDFSALNMVFSGLEVLHLLSPAQKAELLMRPEVESFENGTLSLIFHSLLKGGSEPTAHPGGDHWTTPAVSTPLPSYTTQPTHQLHPRSPHEKLRKILNGFITAVKPIGSFVHEFISFTRQRNASDIRSATMTQFLLNWTLAELADMFHPKDKVPKEPQFDVTNVEDWYQQVVMPVLQRLITNNEILGHQNIKLAFHQLFHLDNPGDNDFSENPEIQDVCSITLDKTHCGLTDAVENVAHVLHCAARTNLTLNEETIMRLILELTKRLNSLIKELSKTNFKEVSSEIKEIFGEGEAPSLTQEHLKDPDFIQLWFQIKLLPLLPDVHPDLLSCLSTKNFSCPVYQTLVSALGGYMSFMEADPMYSQNIYKYFIYSFLQQHNFSESHCSVIDSGEWLEKNVGFFSKFASITDFYELNPNFSGLEALHLLTPNQTAEMLLLPLRTPPEKEVVINHVLNYLIESPEDRKLLEVLHLVIELAQKINSSCSIYTLLLDQLYNVIPSLHPDLEPAVWALIRDLINIVPENCVTKDLMCQQTHVNGTNICKDIDSSDLEFYMSMSTHVPCNFTLDKYACAQLENFAADQLASLLRCDLPGNSSRSRVLWKLLLTKLSNVLDPALDLLADMSVDVISPSASEILDVIGEMRVFLLTDKQLMDSSVIKLWFSERLSGFLPSVSEMFLMCLSSRNLSCQSFHQIVQVFSHQFRDMTFQQQHVILKDFILRFLSEPYTETAICNGVNSTELQLQLDGGKISGRFCNFPVEELACASLSALSDSDLAEMLQCDRSSSSSESPQAWKLLLVKSTRVLDGALDLLPSTTFDPSSPSVSVILDGIRETRLDLFSTDALNNPFMLQLWFNKRLHPFLPAVSTDFLSCLATKELQCSSYQYILKSLSQVWEKMTFENQSSVYTNFIKIYLSRNETAGCVSASNSSAQWLIDNLGSFSELLSVSEMFDLNPHFSPLEALSVLSPKQSAELLVLKHPTLPNTDVIINKLFDYFTESPRERKFTEFLSFLVVFLEMGDLSCLSYKTLFTRLDYMAATDFLDVSTAITNSRNDLSKTIPSGCAIYSGECNAVTANQSDICTGVNSTEFQLQLSSGKMSGRFCDFPVEEIVCASLSALTAQDLAEIMKCDRPSSSSKVWKLLLSEASGVLDEALDLLANSTVTLTSPSASTILDSIQEIRLELLNNNSLNDPSMLQLWFNSRLRPFLPAVSSNFLSCLAAKNLQCSSYQYILQILSDVQPRMSLSRQVPVYTHFIKIYLKRNDTADPGCILNINSTTEWLLNNVGRFSVLLSLRDIREIYPQFSAMEVLQLLSVRQLAEVAATPGLLTSAEQVSTLMSYVPDQQLASFFDNFSPTVLGHENTLPSTVRSAMLQVVFDRANLSSPSVSDAVVLLWLQDRMRPLLVNMAPQHVTTYFNILAGRNCSIEQQGVSLLNLTISSLSNETQAEVQNQIIQALQGPAPLRCYGVNYNVSFYSFLKSSFMGFQFPDLTTFLSLMPQDRKQQLINSMPPSDLGDFLRQTNVVGAESQLCQLYSSYLQIPLFLETESLPEPVRQRTLPCVWPMALRSSSRSEVNAWFDRGLPNYLVFLTKTQISQITSVNASCLAFQKIVSSLGSYNYSVSDFTNQDVYNTIKIYLSSATAPKCYDRNDVELNSTAWFAEYIGPFISFLTVKDLQSFGSQQDFQLFTVNPQNLALLNQSDVDLNLLIYYIQLVYRQDRNLNPLLLPSSGQCFAPGPVFTQLNAPESLTVLENVNHICTDLDPQIAAALASNFGKNIDSQVIAALGNECSSLSVGQIKSIKPSDLMDSLHILSNVPHWSEGQAKVIVQALLFSGVMQINSSSSFQNLGSLLIGLPADVFSGISGSELIAASKNPSVMAHLASAPQVVQQAFVAQILSLDPNGVNILENIPDKFVAEIPRVFLLNFPNDSSTIIKLNNKEWSPQQVELFFDKMSTESALAVLGGPNNLSSSVLQGFTCTGVKSLRREQIIELIKACRREGNDKITLKETQLTCMYNHIKEESDSSSFSLYPPDVLLYYNYSLVPQNSCRLYFEELAHADFSVVSPVLSYKKTDLFDNAKSCLGINSTSLTEDNVSVLGNMCCMLDGSYIQNSHPSILERLKNCPDLTVEQTSAVVTLLKNGNTPYGVPSTWNEQTLKDLGMLTLYLPSSFYLRFDQDTKRNFLKYFLKVFDGVSKEQRKQLKREIRQSIKSDSEQTAECTAGMITQVTISDPTFPFDYNINQFNNCLSVSTVKENLDAITEKVDEEEYLRIVLQKLKEGDNFIIPEDQVQVLKAASRLATFEDIQLWTITRVDTLAALMDSINGQWDPSLAKAIINKYLAVEGNTLGGAELSIIGGPNLCSLDVSDIKTISSQSLKEAKALDVSSCTAEKKKELYNIATEAFHVSPLSVTSYQLAQPYIGGADVDYIRSLVASDVNMDLATFSSLDENVVLALTVDEVISLLGANLPDLKSYENQPLVQTWIRNQYQSQLNILGLGILGGKADPTISPVFNSSTTSPTPTSFTTLDGTTNNRQCQVVVANESTTCLGVNSADLQLQLNSGQTSGRFCDFSVEQFACASLSALTAQELAAILKCDRSSSSSGSIPFWKLLLCKTSSILDGALDLLATTTINPSSPSVSMILDSIQEIRPDLLSNNTLNDPSMLQLWFNGRLRPFLPAVSSNFLSILATKEMECSSYQNILQSLSRAQTQMSLNTQSAVYTLFIKGFLSRKDTAGCASNISADWLRNNLGSFSEFASVSELFDLNPQFNPMEALSVLSPKQSAELLVLKHPTLPNTDIIINKLFDYFTESPRERKFTEFLSFLVVSLNKGNLTCTSYQTLFTRLDFMEATASLDIASFTTNMRANISQNIPLGCIIYGGQCNAIMANESSICIGINSTELQLQLNSGKTSGRFCDFPVEQLACASLSVITSQDLAEIIKCNRSSSLSGSTPVWKLLLSKTSAVLDNALDLLANTTITLTSPSASTILDSIQEIRLELLSNNSLNDPSTLQLWFNSRLRPFLPAVSSNFLSCLAAKNLQCSSYQYIVKILSQVQPQMSLSKQVPVYTNLIKIYLRRNNTADPGCTSNISSSIEWLQNNVGGFSVFLSIKNIKELYPQFSAVDALPLLSVRQLAEVAATPGLLTSAEQVSVLMSYVPDQQLASFFDNFSPTILGHENTLPSTVRSAMLQVVFDRANLSSPSVSDAVVLLWLQDRMRPLLVNMAPHHMTPYFNILAGRNCSIEQQGVKLLDLVISSLSIDAQTEVQNQIIQALRGPAPLRCYGVNYNVSFYSFLKSSFMGFQFPDLTTSCPSCLKTESNS
ncbi:hypothetical protein OJAV_G00003550 [Oryzias javanicus]|uniref:Uncharacterized protein n=1 Tax=Oryzias javanicus TaxID=123683 RepID=A0A3S2MW89_ORYJA|nr:hypothetical protein OJAV_G00003550 [Oryzias javanicus]